MQSAFAGLMCLSMAAIASVYAADTVPLKVEDVWAKPTFAMAKMGAGYFTLTNTTKNAVSISGLSLSEGIANKVELHETYLESDMAKMRRLEMPYVIASGATIEFVPRGKHLMIMGLVKPLEAGEHFDLTLEFTSGDSQTIRIPIKEDADTTEDEDHSHHHHH
jgi:copper(I)-binding protein